ncbi:MAG: hypothetical protein DHS20C05_16090 [Hyphococcus sp.]|nr:MAG: hypothetical protein DHS20C05_16090 [Marinicaulis sp.]
MTKFSKLALLLGVLFIIATFATSIYGWLTIPENTMLARHWGLNGEPDGFSPRNHVLVGMPTLAILLSVLFFWLPSIDPRGQNLKASHGLLEVSWLGAVGIITTAHLSIILPAAHGEAAPAMPASVLYAASLLLILFGNYMAKSRSNFFLGIRTPWTLMSEHAWTVTNRAGGWMFVLTGLGASLTGAVSDAKYGLFVLITGVLTAVVASAIISYLAWKSDPDRSPSP